MLLSPGTRLGPYEITGLAGTGGMGQVYRARDTRLDRTVAIKVLAANPAEHAQMRERFDREARAVSSLNHPHICTLHDIGRAEGVDFFVMEFLDGETLASRLARGPLPPDQAIRTAVEIADGLARAHAAGIVHRDLKPGNIMLTKAGVKLLDFGIAKVPAIGGAPDMLTSTRPRALTEEGSIVGTLQYMAPEQLEGKPLDARTDIFAFGAVLYEMIAGRAAFNGESQASLIAAILRSTPPSLVSVQPLTPPALDRLVMTCLAKQADERWQSTQDLLRELRWLNDRGGSTTTTATAALPATRRGWAIGAAAALVIGAVLGGAAVALLRTPAAARIPSPVGRFAIALPAGDVVATSDNQSAGAALDISRDGSKLVYVDERAGRPQLMLRALDQLEPSLMPGTEGAAAPFFSPDGEWVGFFADGKLKKARVSGGAPLTVADVPPVTRGATWSPDGTIFVTPTYADPIYKVAAAGGTITPVTSLAEGESNHLLPQVLPGGKALVFTAWKGGSFDDASVWLWSAATGGRKLIDSASGARYAPTGHLIFSRGAALLAVPFDVARLEVTGAPMPVADGVLVNPANGTSEFALSETGILVYVAMPATPTGSSLTWIDGSGREERIAEITGDLMRPRLSPDGRRCVVENLNDLWVYEFATGGFRRVTFQGVNQFPVWSPDGKRLTFNRAAAGRPPALFSTPSDGSGQAEALTSGPAVDFPNDWSPDGRVLAFARVAGVAQDNNWGIFGLAPDGKVAPIVNGPFKEFAPTFSPDGRWLAYVSEQSGRREVYVRPYPGSGAIVQITSNGSDEPRWGRDGTELFFYHGAQFMGAQVKTTPELSASRPTVIFESNFRHRFDEPGYPSYDVALEGRRFLMIKPSNSDAAPARFNVVLNWFEELKRRTQHVQ